MSSVPAPVAGYPFQDLCASRMTGQPPRLPPWPHRSGLTWPPPSASLASLPAPLLAALLSPPPPLHSSCPCLVSCSQLEFPCPHTVGASGPWTANGQTNGQTTAESSPGKLTVAAVKITLVIYRNLSPGVSPVSPQPVTLHQSFSLSQPQFPHPWNGTADGVT